MPEFLFSSIFGELTKNVQIRFDAASELNKKLFDNIIFERFLDWDVPTVGLDFEELIGQYNITVAAPTIGTDAKEAILGTEGLETLKETILNHAITLPMTVKDYRKVLQILDSKSLPDKVKTQQLIKLMWGDVETVVKSVLGKLDLIFCGALSNEGKFTLDETTNPEGGALLVAYGRTDLERKVFGFRRIGRHVVQRRGRDVVHRGGGHRGCRRGCGSARRGDAPDLEVGVPSAIVFTALDVEGDLDAVSLAMCFPLKNTL